jgi:aspartyl-tRNA(Asn)/glutamyl-tRNA(Gln) amidotransferase subunit A
MLSHCIVVCFNFVRCLTFQEVPDFASQFASTDLLESKPLKGLRVGLIRETLDDGVDSGVISAIRGAASHLEDLGCSVSEVDFL